MKDEKKSKKGIEATTSRRKFLKSVAAVGGATVLGAPFIGNAEAAKGHKWKIQTTWDAGTTGYTLFENGVRVLKKNPVVN